MPTPSARSARHRPNAIFEGTPALLRSPVLDPLAASRRSRLPSSCSTAPVSLVPLVISYVALEHQMGFALPMLIGTVGGATSAVLALLISTETKGKVFVSDLMSHHSHAPSSTSASICRLG